MVDHYEEETDGNQHHDHPYPRVGMHRRLRNLNSAGPPGRGTQILVTLPRRGAVRTRQFAYAVERGNERLKSTPRTDRGAGRGGVVRVRGGCDEDTRSASTETGLVFRFHRRPFYLLPPADDGAEDGSAATFEGGRINNLKPPQKKNIILGIAVRSSST